jgi:endonuclease YncB( thermonuclease family)
MQQIVGDGRIVCLPDGTRSYERVVASCFRTDGVDIGAEVIREGGASDCPHFSHRRYARFVASRHLQITGSIPWRRRTTLTPTNLKRRRKSGGTPRTISTNSGKTL